ncbi:hypothetical protein C0Q70_19562 [Pomacea canaliculata]|uniref:Uncharacterized protein n=1 Tax=Pomacea canaliculata TaxID=400727 RepID=A0A2T7NJP7_POMCA|nr:hypothetical protein C0Q70_19562 [Pomacea canaliculata]
MSGIVSELRLHGFPAAVPVGRSEHLVQELQQLADNEDLFYFLFRLMLLAAPRRAACRRTRPRDYRVLSPPWGGFVTAKGQRGSSEDRCYKF